jgi:hypothetical protein
MHGRKILLRTTAYITIPTIGSRKGTEYWSCNTAIESTKLPFWFYTISLQGGRKFRSSLFSIKAVKDAESFKKPYHASISFFQSISKKPDL